MKKPEPIHIPVSQIDSDAVGDMLTKGENMRPYLAYYAALRGKGDVAAAAAVIAALPKENRYLYRVFQCLDRALADFDNETAKLDLRYVENLPELREKLDLQLRRLEILRETLARGAQ